MNWIFTASVAWRYPVQTRKNLVHQTWKFKLENVKNGLKKTEVFKSTHFQPSSLKQLKKNMQIWKNWHKGPGYLPYIFICLSPSGIVSWLDTDSKASVKAKRSLTQTSGVATNSLINVSSTRVAWENAATTLYWKLHLSYIDRQINFRTG